jgi:ABC-type dipeptide/oligopeptide/nickel transport system permease component
VGNPLDSQLFLYLGGVLRGDLGNSYTRRAPVTSLIADRLPATIELAMIGLSLAVVAVVPMGILAATRRNSIFDRLSMILTVGGRSIPDYWKGLILIYVFSNVLKLVPFSGRVDFGVGLRPGGTGFYILDSVLQGNWNALRNVWLT